MYQKKTILLFFIIFLRKRVDIILIFNRICLIIGIFKIFNFKEAYYDIYIYSIMLLVFSFCIPNFNEEKVYSKFSKLLSKNISQEKKDPKKILYSVWIEIQDQKATLTQLQKEVQFTEDKKYDFTEEEIQIVENIQKSMEEEGYFTEDEFKKQEIGFTEIMGYEEQTVEEIVQEIEEWDRTGNLPNPVLTPEKIKELQEKEKKEVDDFYKEISSQISQLDNFQLGNIKLNVVVALYYYGVYKDVWRKSPLFNVEIMWKQARNLWELRKQAIDELERRGVR